MAKGTTQSADLTSVFESHNEAARQRKLVERPDPQRALSFVRPRQAGLHSFGKRSLSDSPANTLKLIGSLQVDKNGKDLTGLSGDRNSVAILGNGLGARILTQEELLNQLLHRRNPPSGDGKSTISGFEPDPSFSQNPPPDRMLSHGTHLGHQRTSLSPPRNALSLQQDYFSQREPFEEDLNKQLTPLIPNTPMRKLISDLIQILKMDCMEPPVQNACARLISKTGLLMKYFSQRGKAKGSSSLGKTYYWPSKITSSLPSARSQTLKKPVDIKASQGIPENMYGKLLDWLFQFLL